MTPYQFGYAVAEHIKSANAKKQAGIFDDFQAGFRQGAAEGKAFRKQVFGGKPQTATTGTAAPPPVTGPTRPVPSTSGTAAPAKPRPAPKPAPSTRPGSVENARGVPVQQPEVPPTPLPPAAQVPTYGRPSGFAGSR